MAKHVAKYSPSSSIPQLPSRLNSLLNQTGNWDETVGALTGWRPPATLAPSWKEPLREWIAKLEAALAPMARHIPTKEGLTKLMMLLPTRKGDSTRDDIWLRETFDILKNYPEGVVIDVLNQALRKFEWRPSPKQLLDMVDSEIGGPSDELARLRRLMKIAEQPALMPPREESDAERAAAADAAMAKYRDALAAAGLGPDAKEKPKPAKPCRMYWTPGPDTPAPAVENWIGGYHARKQNRDLPKNDAAVHGYVACAGVAAGELVLSDWLRSMIDHTTDGAVNGT